MTSGNGSLRRIMEKNVGERAGKAEGHWKQTITEGRQVKEKLEIFLTDF